MNIDDCKSNLIEVALLAFKLFCVWWDMVFFEKDCGNVGWNGNEGVTCQIKLFEIKGFGIFFFGARIDYISFVFYVFDVC